MRVMVIGWTKLLEQSLAHLGSPMHALHSAADWICSSFLFGVLLLGTSQYSGMFLCGPQSSSSLVV